MFVLKLSSIQKNLGNKKGNILIKEKLSTNSWKVNMTLLLSKGQNNSLQFNAVWFSKVTINYWLKGKYEPRDIQSLKENENFIVIWLLFLQLFCKCVYHPDVKRKYTFLKWQLKRNAAPRDHELFWIAPCKIQSQIAMQILKMFIVLFRVVFEVIKLQIKLI